MMMSDLRAMRLWYNKSFHPALRKALERGIISKYLFDQLNDPVKKYEFSYKSGSLQEGKI